MKIRKERQSNKNEMTSNESCDKIILILNNMILILNHAHIPSFIVFIYTNLFER